MPSDLLARPRPFTMSTPPPFPATPSHPPVPARAVVDASPMSPSTRAALADWQALRGRSVVNSATLGRTYQTPRAVSVGTLLSTHA